MSKLAGLSLANRSLIALATILVMAFGFVATASLRQELIPSLEFPIAAVATPYQGASPDVVEREVTEPIENAIKGVEGLETITSTSRTGMSSVQVELAYGTDLDRAVQEIQQAIGRISGRLPDNVDPVVQAGSFDDFPVIQMAASAGMTQQELSRRLESAVVPALKGIEGVRDATVTGVRKQEVSILLDPEKLFDKGLNNQTVTQALQANGLVLPGGSLDANGRALSIDVGRSFRSVKDIENIYLAPAPSPMIPGLPPQAPKKPVKLADVATVRMIEAKATAYTRTNGQPTLGISVTKTRDGNTVQISEEIREKVAELRTTLGPGADLTVITDQAPFIQESIEGLTHEGLLGLIFAVVVILLFLFSFRSTLVTAVSIPLSLLIAMIGLYAGDHSLNILTLGGLTIAVGRVVDDSIVVLENIKRHLEYGEARGPAILTAVREVTGAVTASTITTVAVFLPIGLVGGQVGELFRPFAVAVTIALLASLLVSLTIIPVLAYWFLKPGRAVLKALDKAGDDPAAREAAVREIRARADEKERRSLLQRSYVPVIRFAVRHKVITIVVALVIFVGTFGLTSGLKTDFLGDAGANTLNVTQQMPAGTSLAATDAAARKVEQAVRELDGVDNYQVTVGGNGGGVFGGGGGNRARYTINTKPDIDQTAFEDSLRRKLAGLDGVGTLQISEAGGGGFGTSIEVLVQAPDQESLEAATAQVVTAVKGVQGTADVASDLAAEEPGVSVTPDRRKAAEAGLSDAQIAQAVQTALNGTRQSALVGGEQRDVYLRSGVVPETAADLRKLDITSPTGKTVDLEDVATVREVRRPTQLSRVDGERAAKVTAKPEGRDLGTVTADLTERVNALTLPQGAKASIGGVSADQQESFAQLGIALLAAIAIVFLVMVATFRSLIQPLILLVSVPFAATGALGLLRITDTPMGVAAIIGMLMLVGIVVTNAIVLIDLINQYRAEGMGIREAVIEGGRHRLRPILMTAVATICALLPMSLGLTGGGVFISQPLAVVVIGGLVSSTLLTLVLVPTLYTLVEEVKERARRGRGRRRPQEPGPAAESARPELAARA
ncbi:efflux RND transporter permease subunit [Bailinhaonella thermotolerans]|uniref:Efflux RND transporter permease subunit n=2 Tax=Bailinhaonella thermotolerans TaxID=1070861 RepID=A0A3A4BL01_9ACTN|nr:efflux RND transporter permease subunit [Bailinhaonella thermotolerans]